MKRHVQEFGVKPWAGQDLLDLQAEPLKVLDSFFAQYGACVIKGCGVSPAGESIYNIAPGLVALPGEDNEGVETFKAVPFEGAGKVTLPVYLTLTHIVITRAYADKKVRPIAYDYKATATAIRPEGVAFLEITTTGGKRFLDVIKLTEKLDKIGNGKDVTVTFAEATERVNIASGEKLSGLWGKVQKWFAGLKTVAFTGKAADLEQDANNRLVTDTEKTAWADKYTKAQTYTRTEVDNKDAAALQAAKEYAAAKVAEIVNSSPGTLDTLSELAAALGNDPNFATSIMALIGGKSDRVHGHAISEVSNLQNELCYKLGLKHLSAFLNMNNATSQYGTANKGDDQRQSNVPTPYGCYISVGEESNVNQKMQIYGDTNPRAEKCLWYRNKNAGNSTPDEGWSEWRKLWDSGNFNPDNILALKAKVVTEDEAIPDKFCSFQVFHCVRTSVGGTDGYIWAQRWANGNFVTQIFVDADPTNLIAIRTRGNDGVWTSWKKSATIDQLNLKADSNHNHSGVYAPVHDHPYAASGHNHDSVYAAANHTHQNKILCTGKVTSDGRAIFITPGFAISRIDKGVYKIQHTIGSTNYGFTGNGFFYPESRSTFVSMRLCTNTYCEVCNYWGSDGFHDSDFSFMIFGQ